MYSDRHGIFTVEKNRPPTLAEQLAGKRSLTQVGRALDELDIRWIGARSPQAKGRVERLWGTLQDRLTTELRLAGAATLEEANAVLAAYLPRHNRRFTVPADDPGPAWRPMPEGMDPEAAFCFHYPRRVANDATVSWPGGPLGLPRRHDGRSWAGRSVILQERLDGSLWVSHELSHVLATYRDPEGDALRMAMALAANLPVVFTGMGSSLAAAYPAAWRLAASGRSARAEEAGELLHYGADALLPRSLVVLLSQSGRSAETLALGRRLRRSNDVRIVAIVNDVDSPIARLADAVLPMHAGGEVTVATKTFVATFIAAHALSDAVSGAAERVVDLALAVGLPARLAGLASRPDIATEAADRLASAEALVVVARGPSYAAADYGALILKEMAAIPAEPMFGGSFRHGPIEIAGPRVGIVVLAPDGPTRSLAVRLAADTARLGSPTWLLTSAIDGVDASSSQLTVTAVSDVPEAVAPLLYAIPIQHLAAQLAVSRGREPGALQHGTKVTAFE